jgi:hypothetical protein
MKNLDHIRTYLAAREIAECLHVAYWLDGENDSARDHHVHRAHDEFAKLAGLLGYRIEKIQPEKAAAEAVVITEREVYSSDFGDVLSLGFSQRESR